MGYLSSVRGYNLNINAAKIFSDPHPHGPLHGSYFGFALALYNDPNYEDPTVLVGAPRANSSKIGAYEPGVVFKCSLNEDCKEWILDSVTTKLQYGTQIRDQSWFGASILVENKSKPRVMVCHLFIYLLYLIVIFLMSFKSQNLYL